jgi:hypothetical protein
MIEKLTASNAVDCLNGHVILSVERAREVCQVLEVHFDENLVMSWETGQEAQQKYGFIATVSPGTGVDGLRLSYHVAKELGLDAPGQCYIGVGKQSHANQQAIRQQLSILGKL